MKGSARRVAGRGGGRREGASGALRKGASGGVTGGGDGRGAGASTGPSPHSGKGVTGGADSSRGDRCHGWRGERRSHGRGREQVSPEDGAPA